MLYTVRTMERVGEAVEAGNAMDQLLFLKMDFSFSCTAKGPAMMACPTFQVVES